MTGRLLLSAYQCGPGMGSVSQIGWEWYSRLSRRVPVTLITHSRNREAMDRAGAPLGDSEVLYVDTEWIAGPLYRAAKRLFPRSEHAVFLLASLDYFFWDRAAVGLLRRRQRGGESWSIAHAVTPVSPIAAGSLHRLGVPVVLGPWNGGLASPSTFPEIMQDDSAWLYRIRRLGSMADRLRGATRHAALLLTATRAMDASLPARVRSRTVRMLENGVDLETFQAAEWPEAPSPARPLEVLFAGRLVPFKGLPLLLEAVAEVKHDFPVRLTVVGDGPMRTEWEKQSESAGLDADVTFTGPLPLAEVAGAMRRSHVFCLPSVRESGGAVLLEAMASQRPVIAIAHGGPAEVVDSGVGAAIAPAGPEPVIRTLADSFRDIVLHPQEWKRRGEEGRRRAVALFGWERKIDQAIGHYHQLLAGGARL